MFGSRTKFAAAAALAFAASLSAQQPGIGDQFDTVVNYYSSVGLTDAVTNLQQNLASGRAKLEYEPVHGYLSSVLKQLHVPINSQTLVWSKTSSQADHTSPRSPRALYFNDNVYVGWAKDDDLLDVIAVDPRKGPIFFTLDQHQSDHPRFVRDASCMRCHFSSQTLNVPGLVIRSVFAKPDGHPLAQLTSFVAGHNNPLSQRWGGWYVTGTHHPDTHMGNAFLSGQDADHLNLEPTSNITDLSDRFDTFKYLSPDSDAVALLVLDDAVRMQNLITRARFQAVHAMEDPALKNQPADYRQKLIASAAEPLLLYMLFRDEAQLKGKMSGTTDFADEFAKVGPRDSKGRSLRDLDLKTRLFKYPCNYLIYSASFEALPTEMKDYIWQRLSEILTGSDQSLAFKGMAARDRTNVLDILLDTKPEFKAWMQGHDPEKSLSVAATP
jgi:hypothetical protein